MAACDDDGDAPTGPTGPFDLTFTGDASFQNAHGGQEIHVVVESAAGDVVASETSAVSGGDDPSFSFQFSDLLEEGGDYVLKYWIDSNFGGGTEGTCDPPENDYQWRIDLGLVSEGVTVADEHRPAEVEAVCSGGSGSGGGTGDGQDGSGGVDDDPNY